MCAIEDLEGFGREASASPVAGSPPLQRVLVAMRSFRHARNALSFAARTALRGGGSVRIVHVCAGRHLGGDRLATATLDAAVSYAWSYGVDASGVVLAPGVGEVSTAILKEALQWGAGSIVLPEPPRRFPGPWDKQARDLVRSAPCPVFISYGEPR